MHLPTRLAVAALVVGVVAGCAADGPAVPQSGPATATPSATTPSPRPSGPPTTIPEDVALPHEWTWPAADGAQPLVAFCLDPRDPALRPPGVTDLRLRAEVGRRSTRTEALGVYRDRRRAGRAIEAWRGQAARCADGSSVDHVGEAYEWSVARTTVRGADEAWLAQELSSQTRLRDGRLLVSTVVVARVGNAVYAQHTRRPVRPGTLPVRLQQEVAAVASYVPSLAVFAAP